MRVFEWRMECTALRSIQLTEGDLRTRHGSSAICSRIVRGTRCHRGGDAEIWGQSFRLLLSLDGEAVENRAGGRAVSRHHPRQRAQGRLPRRQRSGEIPPASVAVSGEVWVPALCLLPDGQSRPPGDRDWQDPAVEEHGGAAVFVHPVFQSATRAGGPSLSGQVQGLSRGGGSVRALLDPLHPRESREGRGGGEAGGVCLVERSVLPKGQGPAVARLRPDSANVGKESLCGGSFLSAADARRGRGTV